MEDRKCSGATMTLLLGLILAVPSTAMAASPRELSWDDLVPEPGTPLPPPRPPQYSGIPNPNAPPIEKPVEKKRRGIESPFAHMYPYNPVLALNGKYVKLPGYIVPLESDAGGLLTEFLLVPYFGACIHVPPPPSNQIVYVKLQKPYELKSMGDPVWITGTLATQLWTSDVADADYVMKGDKIEKFDVN